jgi:hypothetical protein
MRRELLQWYGLLGAAMAWAAQLVVGFGVSYADCTAASRHWGLDVVTWQIVLLVVGVSFAALAEAAAVTVLRQEPEGRRHFFAFAAALGNVLFLTAIVLTAVGVLSNATCRPA